MSRNFLAMKAARSLWRAVLKDRRAVISGSAADWTAERVRRAMYEEPWLLNRYVDGVGREHSVHYPSEDSYEIPWWEHSQRFRQSIPYLYQEACRARELAKSHRNFNGGTALLAYKPGVSLKNTWQVHLGMNLKPYGQMRPICSEPIALGSAMAAGCTLGIGGVVTGVPREQDEDPELHPCEECRPLMMHLDGQKGFQLPPEFWVVCAHPQNGTGMFPDISTNRKIFSLDRLLRYHGEAAFGQFRPT